MISNYVQSISILNRLNQNVNLQSKWMRHISTGMRVAGVADDPSGWAIGQRMSVRLRSLDRAIQNAQSHSSMLKVAEGAGQSSLDVLRMLKEKAIEAASDTATDEDRKNLQKYFDQFADQIDDNASVTYNGMALLDGSKSGAAQTTAQVYTNGSLGAGTTAATKLTDLSRRDGTALDIRSDDTITVSYVKDGKTVQTAYQVGDTTVRDIFDRANAGAADGFDTAHIRETAEIGTDSFGNVVYTPNGENAISVARKTPGTEQAISGLTIRVTGRDGQVKKTVDAALSAFTETIRPRDAKADTSPYAQLGTRAGAGLESPLEDMSATALGLKGRDGSVIDVTTRDHANAAISVLDQAMERLLDQQTSVGAMQMRMDYSIQNLTTESESLTDAMSTIMDADMAREMTALARTNILVQAAQAMLAQSNQNAGWFLSLLGA